MKHEGIKKKKKILGFLLFAEMFMLKSRKFLPLKFNFVVVLFYFLFAGDLKMTHESLNNQVQNTYLPPPLMAMQLKMASTVSPFLPPQTFVHKGGVKVNS